MHSLSGNIKLICTYCETGQKSSPKSLFYLCLKLVQINFYIFRQSTNHVYLLYSSINISCTDRRGHCGCDQMVVGLTTTYSFSDLLQVGGFFLVLWFPLPIKLAAII